MSTLVCLGLGYCARHYVAAFGARFARIVGTSREPPKSGEPSVTMLAFDGVAASQELRAAVADASHLLISAAPGESGDPVLAALRNDIANAPQLQSVVYLSSLGVYGDHGGAWIDETAPTIPAHARGASRAGAEQAWQALGSARNVPVAILRLAGIYGPGQNAFVRLRAGRAHRIAKPGHVFNRVHVFDIAQAIEASFARGFGGIVNVTDDLPAPPGDQIVFAAQLLGIEPPPEISLEEAERTLPLFVLSFYRGCARVRNERLKRDLGVALRYPTFREGLAAIFESDFANTN
ncbi:MAG: SDR family oxidoreductase [Alphaproteobacteria bacterium]|nr:SDR family oxidoreductase [Alphaproteobacteria bacterium]